MSNSPLLRVVPAFATSISAAGIIYGIGLCSFYQMESFEVPALAILAAAAFALWAFVKVSRKENDRSPIVIVAICLASIALILVLPQGWPQTDRAAVVHIYRSFVAATAMICLGVALLCNALYRLLGSTPRAFDNSRYPIVVLPIAIVLIAYSLIIFLILAGGIPSLSWQLISTGYDSTAGVGGIRNDIIGTLMLMLLTSLISLPVGVGAGIYMSEYGGRIAGLIDFSTTLLRAMPVVILGLGAYGVATMTWDTPLRGILAPEQTNFVGRGTFLLAAIFLSMLVIPLIAKATEEGFRSLPRDLREGSLAVGATEGYTLMHVLLPWSLPNILTGLLLGCAEVAGSVTVIVLLCGFGDQGLLPVSEATSLAHFIYRVMFGSRAFNNVMGHYTYAVALVLLLITLGLTAAYLVMRNRFAQRYRTH